MRAASAARDSGLTICKRLVTMMGGGIDMASEGGHGTRFTVRVSLPEA